MFPVLKLIPQSVKFLLILFIFLFTKSGAAFAQKADLVFPNNEYITSDTALTFSWNSIKNAVSYQLQLATDNGFNNIVVEQNSIGITNQLITGLTLNTNYYWRVRGFDGVNYLDWSDTKTISIFSPQNFNSLQVWLRADSGIVFNGNNIEQWKDISGKKKNAYQNIVSRQPAFINSVSSLNNKPVIKLDGVDDMLLIDSSSTLASAFIVFNWNGAGTTFPTYNGLLTQQSYLSSFRDVWVGLPGNASIYLGTTDTYFLPAEVKVNGVQTNNLDPIHNYKIVSGVGTIPAAFTNFLIGRYNTSSDRHWNGNIAEIIMYDNALSESERIKVEQYLRYKYAPPVNLGKDINISNGFCDTVLDAGKRFSSYLWSTGATTQTISINKTGKYWVNVSDIFGFSSSDTIQVTYPYFKQLGDSSFCAGDSIIWNTGLNKQLYTFEWSNNAKDSSITIKQPGDYWVKISDSFGCFIYSDTIKVQVDTFALYASLGADTTLCSGNTIQLKKGAEQANGYLWSDGSKENNLKIENTGLYWVSVSDNLNCKKTDTIHVTVSGTAPTVDFLASQICIGNATQFQDISISFIGDEIATWHWEFGDGDTSNLKNPQHIYADTGQYNVSLFVIAASGCSAIINKKINVYPNPKANFDHLTVCEKNNAQFHDLTNTFNYPITKWLWNFNDEISGDNIFFVKDPLHKFSAAKSYTVKLLVENDKGCIDSITKQVEAQASPKVDFLNTATCKGEEIEFTDNSTIPFPWSITSINWDFGNGKTSAQQYPTYAYADTGTYIVSLTVSVSNGCSNSISKPITVHPKPKADFIYENTCEKSPVEFTDNSKVDKGKITKWIWSFDKFENALSQNPLYTFPDTGSYTIKLIALTGNACSDTTTKNIYIHETPVSAFSFLPPYGGGAPLTVNFSNSAVNATTYLWDFDDGIQSVELNPVHVYQDTGSFYPSLTITNKFACKNTITKNIRVTKSFLDIAVLGLNTFVKNNYLSITADIANLGTVNIPNLKFNAHINDGPAIQETWNNPFLIGAQLTYNFNASLYLPNSTSNGFVCVSVEIPDNLKENNIDNNMLCKGLNESEFAVLDLFPNPANEQLTIPLILPNKNDLSITIYEVNGNTKSAIYYENLNKGFNFIAVDTKAYSPGIYACLINYNNTTLIRKFLKY